MVHNFQSYSYAPTSTSGSSDHHQILPPTTANGVNMADPRTLQPISPASPPVAGQPYPPLQQSAYTHQAYDPALDYRQQQHQHHQQQQQQQQQQHQPMYGHGGNGGGGGGGYDHNLTLPSMANYGPPTTDTTGQIAPPNMRPKLTTSVFEEEGSLCFQVDVDGICVARREDNHMINGTKLLNVAGMTRGRRDGILKAEKAKKVVKIGPMHLKGVWIPFDRALTLANQEKITEKLYPLFVHNISSLLYHPSNLSRPPPLPQPFSREELPPLQYAQDPDLRTRPTI